MKTIPLSRGLCAIVDDEDFDALALHKWSVTGQAKYAFRNYRRHDGAKRALFMHRVILEAPHHLQVDHVNRDGLDNRRSNLRLATQAQNNWNAICRKHSSRFKGVSWYKRDKLWEAAIKIHDRRLFLGRFQDEIEAARAYDEAAKEFYGEFARTNL